ncbi:MAG: hypothetical protein HN790_09880 [Methylococcales bacterium]|jgi:hypothetical protein|nr:hypothetical protein [Methylococcales bacterium]
MIRLLLLSASATIIMAGFVTLFTVKGAGGYLLSALLILLGSVALWLIEVKTIKSLDKGGLLNKIFNTNEGPD